MNDYEKALALITDDSIPENLILRSTGFPIKLLRFLKSSADNLQTAPWDIVHQLSELFDRRYAQSVIGTDAISYLSFDAVLKNWFVDMYIVQSDAINDHLLTQIEDRQLLQTIPVIHNSILEHPDIMVDLYSTYSKTNLPENH